MVLNCDYSGLHSTLESGKVLRVGKAMGFSKIAKLSDSGFSLYKVSIFTCCCKEPFYFGKKTEMKVLIGRWS